MGGEWRDGTADGYGTFIKSNPLVIFACRWTADSKEGEGVESWPDGTKYKGDFCNDARHGYGEYEGPMVDDSLGVSYCGSWAENNFEGPGVYHWEDGRSFSGIGPVDPCMDSESLNGAMADAMKESIKRMT